MCIETKYTCGICWIVFAGAWIISGGTNTGVMKIVGEAVNDYQMTSASSDQKIVALGIATWGIINNKKALVNPDGRVGIDS